MEEYDPQIMRQFMDELQRTGKVTKETADQIAASGSTLQKYMQKLGEASASASGEILKGAKNLGFGLVEGQRKFQDLNPVIDTATKSVSDFASAFGFVGKVVSAFVTTFGEASKVMLRQMDIQMQAFTDIGDVGGLAVDGFKGLQTQFLASGLTLESYAKAIRNSSTTLARFSGTVASGAQVFSEASQTLTREIDIELRRLGFSADDLGETLEAFIGRQTRLGRSQGLEARDLADQTQAYAKELDLLSRATGMSRKAIMQQQDAALSEARFRSTIEGIQNEGVRTNLLNFQTSVASVSQGLGQGIRDMASGFFNTEEAQALMIQTGGAAASILGDLKGGLIDEFEARRRLQSALRDNSRQLLTDLGPAIGEASLATRNAAGVFDLMNADVTSSGFKIRKEQDGLAGGTNDLTNNMVQAQKNIEGMNIKMQELFLLAMPNAAKAVKKFSKVMEETITKITGKFTGVATKEQTENFRNLIDQMIPLPSSGTPGTGSTAMQSYDEATKNLLAANVKPDVAIVKTAQIQGLHDAKKISRASDDAPLASILGFDAVSKFGVATVGEFKSKIADMDLSKPSGPKQSYSSMTAGLDTSTVATSTTETTQQATMSTDMSNMFKMLAGKLDETNDILTKGNRIGERTYRSNLA